MLDPIKGALYPQELYFVYDTVEVNNSPGQYSFKDLAAWAIIPFVVAGMLLFLALRFCISKYKGMVPDTLAEEP